MKTYGLIALGSGSASGPSIWRARSAGWSVAVVDSRPLGGTCALRGCHPKKMLRGGAEAMDWFARFRKNGVIEGSAEINWEKLQAFKETDTAETPAFFEKMFKEKGVDIYRGRASFTGPKTISIDGEEIKGEHILIATGAKPAELPIPGFELLLDSTAFMELKALPESILFVGGGYISFEFAHIAARAGARVTILHRGEKALELFDNDVVELLLKRSREAGIEIALDTNVDAIEGKESAVIVTTTDRESGEKKVFEADAAVHGAGRVPEIDDLNLDAAGVKREKRGVTVDEHLRTSAGHIFAAGDAAASGPPLTPVASHEGAIVAENMVDGKKRRADYTGLASVAFTIPPIASVGMTEAEAREKGLDFRANFADTGAWFSAKHIAETAGGYKILIENATEKILGAHLFGQRADEVVNVFALAVRAGVPAARVKEVLFAYPTESSDIASML